MTPFPFPLPAFPSPLPPPCPWVQTVWKDPYCGDGRCDDPLEFPAFGNLGCAVDCGTFANVTTIRVVMSTNFHSEADRAASSWNLCLVYPLNDCWYDLPGVPLACPCPPAPESSGHRMEQ